MLEKARGNIEQNLGCCFESEDEPSPDSIYEEAYVLGFDALADAGVEHSVAREIAAEAAQLIAQP